MSPTAVARRLGACQEVLYAAEAETIGDLGVRWPRISDVRLYLERLVESEWFAQRWPHFVRCDVERRGSGSVWSTCHRLDDDGPDGRATEGVVLLADGALIQPVVLHELAHLLLPMDSGHGPDFAETLLTLVRGEMGFFAFAALYHALRRREGFQHIRQGIDAGR
jgi:putative metallohydrolase (TIGR04338 family)